jgi:hypothetical protein
VVVVVAAAAARKHKSLPTSESAELASSDVMSALLLLKSHVDSGVHIMTTRSLFVYQTPGEHATQDPPP